MAFDPAQKTDKKQGLLAYKGVEPGQSFDFLDEAGIANRVSEKGKVEWILHDPLLIWFDWTEPIRDYLARREDQVYRDIFRGWHLFSRALMGSPVRPRRGGWPVETLSAPFQNGTISTLWEEAPNQIQKIAAQRAHLSALKYLEPQLRGQ